MNWAYTEEQEEVRNLARKILEDLATHDRLVTVEASDEGIDRELYTALGRANLLGVGIEEAYGGSEMGFFGIGVLLVGHCRPVHEKLAEVRPVLVGPGREVPGVRAGRLVRADGAPVGEGRRRHLHIDHLGTELRQRVHRLVNGGAHRRVDALGRVPAIDAEPHAAYASVQRPEDRLQRLYTCRRIVWIDAGNRLEHDRRVGDAPSHRANVVERAGEGNQTVA